MASADSPPAASRVAVVSYTSQPPFSERRKTSPAPRSAPTAQRIDEHLRPARLRAHAAPFAGDVDDNPATLALQEVLERQVHQLVAAQAEADDQAMSVFGGASSSF